MAATCPRASSFTRTPRSREGIAAWLDAGALAVGIGSQLGTVAQHGADEVERRARAVLDAVAETTRVAVATSHGAACRQRRGALALLRSGECPPRTISRGRTPHPGAELTGVEKIPLPFSYHTRLLPSGDQDGSGSGPILRPGPIAQRGSDSVDGLPVR